MLYRPCTACFELGQSAISLYPAIRMKRLVPVRAGAHPGNRLSPYVPAALEERTTRTGLTRRVGEFPIPTGDHLGAVRDLLFCKVAKWRG